MPINELPLSTHNKQGLNYVMEKGNRYIHTYMYCLKLINSIMGQKGELHPSPVDCVPQLILITCIWCCFYKIM